MCIRDRAYASCADAPGVLDEFRDMVKALHRAGIEVILDVVYNHTAEGGHDGPTLSWRGLANDTSVWGTAPIPGRLLTIGCLQPTDLSQASTRNVVVAWDLGAVVTR